MDVMLAACADQCSLRDKNQYVHNQEQHRTDGGNNTEARERLRGDVRRTSRTTLHPSSFEAESAPEMCVGSSFEAESAPEG